MLSNAQTGPPITDHISIMHARERFLSFPSCGGIIMDTSLVSQMPYSGHQIEVRAFETVFGWRPQYRILKNGEPHLPWQSPYAESDFPSIDSAKNHASLLAKNHVDELVLKTQFRKWPSAGSYCRI
jgi:hypothetical protein